MKVPMPRLYMGTMTFGWSQTSSFVDENIAKEMTKKFIEFGEAISSDAHYIDTARIYAGGKTEPIVGNVLKDAFSYCSPEKVMVGTKAHPSQPQGLSKDGIMNQFNESI